MFPSVPSVPRTVLGSQRMLKKYLNEWMKTRKLGEGLFKVKFILQIPLTIPEHLDRKFWKVLIVKVFEFGDKEFT